MIKPQSSPPGPWSRSMSRNARRSNNVSRPDQVVRPVVGALQFHFFGPKKIKTIKRARGRSSATSARAIFGRKFQGWMTSTGRWGVAIVGGMGTDPKVEVILYYLRERRWLERNGSIIFSQRPQNGCSKRCVRPSRMNRSRSMPAERRRLASATNWTPGIGGLGIA
jgi:hypothetical protein